MAAHNYVFEELGRDEHGCSTRRIWRHPLAQSLSARSEVPSTSDEIP
jgi:hypothetical protein